MSNEIINLTDSGNGSIYSNILDVCGVSRLNLQYLLVSGDGDNIVKFSVWSTLYADLAVGSDDGWVNITKHFSDSDFIIVTNGTIQDMLIYSGNIPFDNLRIKFEISGAVTPNNSFLLHFKAK